MIPLTTAMLRPALASAILGVGALCAASPAHAQTPRLPSYVGSDACVDCHDDAFKAWSGSHHALAWTAPTPDNILADFEGTSFSLNGEISKFEREGDTSYVTTPGPDGKDTRYPLAGVVGIEPLQQYLLETAPGKLQSFDVVWDTEEGRWYHLYPDQELKPGEGLHWTGPYKTWNTRCAECHATDYDKAYDPLTATYSSSQAEIGVGCEACHGPSKAHLEWAELQDNFDHAAWTDVGLKGLTLNFDALDAAAEISQCAGCHSRREPFGDRSPEPGTPFHDSYRLALLREGAYHADGQIQDEVYVYGSFLQSKMYDKGVRCSDCHDPHAARLKADGNAVCTQCHSTAGNTRFPTLPLADYDSPEHHFHPEASDGAQCKSCHMIERVYMGTDGRRDHSFRVPRPDLTVEIGTPNACNDCHTDQTAAWAAQVLDEKFPDSAHRGPHFATTFAAARVAPATQTSALMDIARETSMPGIVRASALDLLGLASTPDIADLMEPLLADEDPLVRAAAVSVQRGAEPVTRVQRLANLLGDPVKLVRLATVREFLDAPPMRLPDRLQRNLESAMAEWQGGLTARADFPETQMILGGLGLTMRNMPAALAAFGEAVEQDPQMEDAWVMMIRIQAAVGDVTGARATVRRGLIKNPDSAILRQYLLELQP